MAKTQQQELDSKSHVDFIAHLIVRLERCSEMEDIQQQFISAAKTFTGYQSSSVHRIEGGPEGYQSYAAVHRFDTPKNLIEWLESDKRRQLVKQARAKLGDDLTVDYPMELAGFSSWFSDPSMETAEGKRPSVWKQSLIVIVALYPLSLIIGALVSVVIPNAHPATTRLIVAIIAVSLMGFFIVPMLCTALQSWIRSTTFWTQSLGAVGLLAILFFLWIMMHVFIANPNDTTTDTTKTPAVTQSNQGSSVVVCSL